MQKAIDRILENVIRDSGHQKLSQELVNQCVGSRNLQILFVKASARIKKKMRTFVRKIIENSNNNLTQDAKNLKELIDRFFVSKE